MRRPGVRANLRLVALVQPIVNPLFLRERRTGGHARNCNCGLADPSESSTSDVYNRADPDVPLLVDPDVRDVDLCAIRMDVPPPPWRGLRVRLLVDLHAGARARRQPRHAARLGI